MTNLVTTNQRLVVTRLVVHWIIKYETLVGGLAETRLVTIGDRKVLSDPL